METHVQLNQFALITTNNINLNRCNTNCHPASYDRLAALLSGRPLTLPQYRFSKIKSAPFTAISPKNMEDECNNGSPKVLSIDIHKEREREGGGEIVAGGRGRGERRRKR